MTTMTRGKALETGALVSRRIDSPLGEMLAVASDRGLCLLEFADRRALAAEMEALRRRFGTVALEGENEHLDRTTRELGEYFRGERRRFDVALDVRGTGFQSRVWERLAAIPFGETRSYAEIARELGMAGCPRAVGQANGRNCVAIVVPCHRVVNADGSLGGYGGGLERKRWLLEFERGCGSGVSLFGER